MLLIFINSKATLKISSICTWAPVSSFKSRTFKTLKYLNFSISVSSIEGFKLLEISVVICSPLWPVNKRLINSRLDSFERIVMASNIFRIYFVRMSFGLSSSSSFIRASKNIFKKPKLFIVSTSNGFNCMALRN